MSILFKPKVANHLTILNHLLHSMDLLGPLHQGHLTKQISSTMNSQMPYCQVYKAQ